MVLAAGLGSRLRPLTDVCAKPLVPVGDRPALAHIVERLRAARVPRMVVNAHHRAADVRAFACAQPDVAVSEERDLLGTAGGLHRAGPLLGEGHVLVWNGDILADFDPKPLADAHVGFQAEGAGCAATMVVQPLAAGEGSVGLDSRKRIVRLRRSRFADEASGGQFIGIYALSPDLRTRLPEVGGMIEDVLIPALARGAIVRALLYEGPWHDIGTIPSYLNANLAWLASRQLRAWMGPGARVAERVLLDGAIVGAGSLVEGQGTVARSVVWPGARATAPLEGIVVPR